RLKSSFANENANGLHPNVFPRLQIFGELKSCGAINNAELLCYTWMLI
ncbi:MAG: hypothetical protein RUDDFDWM_002119, partial [Candidatus Fervidibacterota bacterium]